MTSRFPRVLLALVLVAALSQVAVLTSSPFSLLQTALADSPTDSPPDSKPTPTPPVKTTPDTFVPATTSSSSAKAQSYVQSVGPGAIRPGFDSQVLNPNDDGSTGLVPIGFPINFFGTSYGNLYVNNNGNVTFNGPLGTYTPFNIVTTGTIIIAPFFADVDTRSAGQPTMYGPGTVGAHQAFGVSWRDVDYFSSSTSHTNRNYFQLVLVDQSDIAPGDFDIEFNYDQIQWEAGTASNSDFNGLGGYSARAGYSNGAAAAFELPGSAVNGAFLDSNAATGLALHSFNSSQTGRYVYEVRGGYAPASLTTGTVNLNAGTNILSNVTLQNVPVVGLDSYSMTINFDPAVVTVASVGDGDAPFGTPATATIDNTAGTLILADAQTGATPSGTIVLARLNLHGVANGNSPLGITGETLTAVGGGAMLHVITPGVATVNTPELTPGSGTILVGSDIDVPVSIMGLANQSLAAYNVTISFDKTKITVSGVSGGAYPFGSPTPSIDNGAGMATFSQTAASDFPTGGVHIATLTLHGVAPGSSTLTVTASTLTNSASGAIAHTSATGVVTVTEQLTLTRIEVTPHSPSVPVTGTQIFAAQGYDQYDNPMSGLAFSWSCTNSDAGSIDASGLFTAGQVSNDYPDVIEASSGSVTGKASVTVTPGRLDHIIISPANPTVAVGHHQLFIAEGYDQYDNARAGDAFVWLVSDAAAGVIDATGLFTAGSAPGAYTNVIHATSGTVNATASVTLIPDLKGDVNHDGHVDAADLVAVAAAFGSMPPSPNWNAAADLNGDGVVNVFDLVIVGLNFGNHV